MIVRLKKLIIVSMILIFLPVNAEDAKDKDKDIIEKKQIIENNDEKSNEENNKENNKERDSENDNNKKYVDIETDDSMPIPDDQTFNIKLRNLEEKINSLKDKIFRAKQRLSILQETVLSGALAGARATIIHNNTVGGAFELVSAIYYLDEAPIYKKIDRPEELEKEKIVIFDGSVVPGPHHISVYLVFKGKGFGIFSYMKGYTFKLKAGHSFNVEEGKLIEVTATPKDKGALQKLDNRLYMTFDVDKKVYQKEAGEEEKIEGEG